MNAPATTQRLAGRDVRRDLLVGHVREVHGRRRGRGGHLTGRRVVEAVPGAEHAGPTAHRLPAAYGVVGVVGLAERLAVEVEHGVAAEHQRAGRYAVAGDDRRALQLGELERELGRRQPVELGLVDPGDDHHRLDAGAAQGGQAGGGLGGEDEGGHAGD